jgi:HCOMODA/2-hydroxy-3-carboxy-muconic semialdehyde decarboxylase
MTLMRGHGCTITGLTLQDAVITAVYAEVNARLQMQAMALGEVEYMTPGEVSRTTDMVAMPLAVDRVWEYFVARADCSGI